jgi:hypothetical protein
MGGRKVASAATAEQPLPLTGGFAPATHPDRITGLRRRGFELVTASDLIARG